MVAYVNDQAVGCGALKEFNTDTLEIKRMYLKLANRRSDIATEILNALEVWAKELGYLKTVLETGTRQVEALKFYHKSGYHRIPNYAPYAHMEKIATVLKKIYKNERTRRNQPISDTRSSV